MRLGIIIVVYGTQERLRRHLNALCAQTRMPDAVIIVDNGAGDLAWTAKMPFQVEVVSAGDVGPAGGFRIGAMHACRLGCDYVAFADDDAIPARDVVGRLHAHMESGAGAVAGSYAGGAAITLANHYLMVKREAMAGAGLHFAPFFMQSEDMEYFERLERAVGVLRDPAIRIDHPFRMADDSLRAYLMARNTPVHMALRGSASGFAFSFVSGFVRSLFVSLRFRNPSFFFSFLRAVLDFSSCRMGRPDIRPWRIPMTEAAAPPDALVAGDGGVSFGGSDGAGDYIRRLARFALEARGRDVLLNGPYFLAFPPYSVFAREVYVRDAGGVRLIMRNSPFLSFLFAAAALPIAFFMLAPALAAFSLRRSRYRRMLEEQISEDRDAVAATPKTSFSRPRP